MLRRGLVACRDVAWCMCCSQSALDALRALQQQQHTAQRRPRLRERPQVLSSNGLPTSLYPTPPSPPPTPPSPPPTPAPPHSPPPPCLAFVFPCLSWTQSRCRCGRVAEQLSRTRGRAQRGQPVIHNCTGTGPHLHRNRLTSARGMGSPLPHLHRDWRLFCGSLHPPRAPSMVWQSLGFRGRPRLCWPLTRKPSSHIGEHP